MRQRLGIAAALLGDPRVLILDEPANGLDPEGIVWIRGLMRRLAREGRTVLVSSHLMTETALAADHLVVLGRGRLLADTPMADFVGDHASLEDAYLRLTVGAAPFSAPFAAPLPASAEPTEPTEPAEPAEPTEGKG